MTLEESREIIPLMESMIGQIEEQQNLMAEMILEMQNRDTQLSLMQKQNQKLQKLNNELSELLNCSRSKFLTKLLKTFDKTFREIFPVFISTKRREKPSAFLTIIL